ncbi:MAG: NAD(+) diphosphatase [Acidimicrobiia bacterium]|nr:NAD(+) diphosphatase [Acidimicrobiia bacterium]MDH5236593.1 NAD(+) diphosphatase [Acidimicrobiia bacterium]
MQFHPANVLSADIRAAEPVWLVVHATGVLRTDDSWPTEGLPSPEPVHVLGTLDRRPVYGVGVPDAAEAPPGSRFVDLFSLHAEVGHEQWLMAGRAVQIVEWARTHRFCGRCGVDNILADGERAMRCPRCGLLSFPRLSPAVIMAVHRDDEILLARGAQFVVPMYSTLAGFVEPGETIEAAVRREVREEVGLTVGGLEYFDSQPWPFPNSLMLGFFAEYHSGQIVPDPTEILEASWYHYGDLPAIPPDLSIANRLIMEFVRRRTG